VTSNRQRRLLSYIRDAITLIERRTQAGRDTFLDDVDVQDAVLWRLEAHAEATNRVTPESKARHSQIPWRAIYGFRNIAAHGYLDLHIDRVWEIVEVHLPALKAAIEAELRRE